MRAPWGETEKQWVDEGGCEIRGSTAEEQEKQRENQSPLIRGTNETLILASLVKISYLHSVTRASSAQH